MTALTSLRCAFGLRILVGATLLVPACQLDSAADFDDPTPTGTAGSGANGGTEAAGAGADAGGGGTTGSDGGSETGGQSGAAAGGTSAGKAAAQGGKGGTAGMGGAATGGGGGRGGAGGKAGAGGTGGTAGKGGAAGNAGTGGVANPDPETLETRELEDATIVSCLPNQTLGSAATINVDGDFACTYYALVSVPLTGVPAGAVVSKATLTLECENAGDSVSISYAEEPWKESTVRWSTRPNSGSVLGTVRCEEDQGPVVIDLKAAVVAWLAGERENYGIYLRSEQTDGTDFTSGESQDTEHRPLLSITYTPPIK